MIESLYRFTIGVGAGWLIAQALLSDHSAVGNTLFTIVIGGASFALWYYEDRNKDDIP